MDSAFYLAGVLATFRQSSGMTDRDLANYLQCEPDALIRLALCRRPDPEGNRFGEDVVRIAIHLNLNPLRLANLVRMVDALAEMEEMSKVSDTRGTLQAARDKGDWDKPENGGGTDA